MLNITLTALPHVLFHSAKSQQCLDFVLGTQVNEQHYPVAALNKTLKPELQRLKVATGEMGNQMMYFFNHFEQKNLDLKNTPIFESSLCP